MIEIPRIKLPKTGKLVSFNSCFYHATDGEKADFETNFSLKYTSDSLIVDFQCFDNNFTNQNTMTINNEDLFNQEVFEVFIAAGNSDPKAYLEIEVNPNNAIWLGRMSNPSLGLEDVCIDQMLVQSETGIKHNVTVNEKSWSGYVEIPWTIVSTDPNESYRINFHRIRSFTSHIDPAWVCDVQTCDFICFSSTLSGPVPAFHRPRRFAFLELV